MESSSKSFSVKSWLQNFRIFSCNGEKVPGADVQIQIALIPGLGRGKRASAHGLSEVEGHLSTHTCPVHPIIHHFANLAQILNNNKKGAWGVGQPARAEREAHCRRNSLSFSQLCVLITTTIITITRHHQHNHVIRFLCQSNLCEVKEK